MPVLRPLSYDTHHVRRTRGVLALLVCIAVVVSPSDRLLQAGILGDAASETRSTSSESSSSRQDDHCRCDDDDDGFGSFLWDLTVGSFLHVVFGGSEWRQDYDACGRPRWSRWYLIPTHDDEFAPFPYHQDTPGIIVPPDHPCCESCYFSARLAFEYGYDFDVLDRFAGSALVEWRNGLGFDASGHIYREELAAGGQDELSVGDVNVMWRMVETERTQWRLGLGVNWLADSIDTEAGLNFTLRADYFPVKPLILSGELDCGTIGSAGTFHGRGSVGFNIRQTEFFVGYDYRSIGEVDLEGPMLGVQFWY